MSMKIGPILFVTAIIFGAGLASLVAYSVIIITSAPNSDFAIIVGNYQTFFASILGLVAAIFTVFSVYAAAQLPIKAQMRIDAEQRSRDTVYGASIIASEVSRVSKSFLNIDISYANRDPNEEFIFTEIKTPVFLENFQVIRTQKMSVVIAVSGILDCIRAYNQMSEIVIIPKDSDEFYGAFKTIYASLDTFENVIIDELSEIE
ncbi:MAG: hypothetical protein RIC36_02890 [Rhodospirillales bacterium]